MSRDVRDWERNERRSFGGPDDWDAERDYGISPDTRDRYTRRSGWQSSPVTSYREAGSQRQRESCRPGE